MSQIAMARGFHGMAAPEQHLGGQRHLILAQSDLTRPAVPWTMESIIL
jgi:hypothetical protein